MQILIFWQGVRSFYGFYSNMTRASKRSTFIGVQVLKDDQKENKQEVNMLKSNYFDQIRTYAIIEYKVTLQQNGIK